MIPRGSKYLALERIQTKTVRAAKLSRTILSNVVDRISIAYPTRIVKFFVKKNIAFYRIHHSYMIIPLSLKRRVLDIHNKSWYNDCDKKENTQENSWVLVLHRRVELRTP